MLRVAVEWGLGMAQELTRVRYCSCMRPVKVPLSMLAMVLLDYVGRGEEGMGRGVETGWRREEETVVVQGGCESGW